MRPWQELWPSWISICSFTKYADMVSYVIYGIICSYVINCIICSKYVKYLSHFPRTKANLYFSCLIILMVYNQSLTFVYAHAHFLVIIHTLYTARKYVLYRGDNGPVLDANQPGNSLCMQRRWRMDNRKNWCLWRGTLCQTLLWCDAAFSDKRHQNSSNKKVLERLLICLFLQ